MKVRVKQGHTAYLFNRRYREGMTVEIPEKMFRRADQAYIDALEKKLTKEVGPVEAKKHGLKPGSLIFPKWAELPSKPIGPEPTVPGHGQKPSKDLEEATKDESAAGGDQKVL